MILLLGRRRRKRRKELEAAGLAAVAQTETAPLTPQEGADIMNLQTEKSMELRKDVRKFAEDNPEIAAQMVKSWLRAVSYTHLDVYKRQTEVRGSS